MTNYQNLADRFSISLSILCTIHCLGFPLFLALAPSLSALSILDDCVFHQWMALTVLPFSFFALYLGTKKHQKKQFFLTGSIGVGLLLLTAFFGHDLFGESGEKSMTLIGSVIVAASHLLNNRCCKHSKSCLVSQC